MIVGSVLPADWTQAFSRDHRRIGIGIDPATTTKKKSNPSSIAVIQQVGLMYFVRLVVRFKTSDDRVTTGLLREIVKGLPHGLKARRCCILANNERFYAGQLRRAMAGIVPVQAVIESEGTIYLSEKMSFKQYLGNQFINTIDDGYLALPDEAWLKADIRQTERNAGTFTAEPDENGNHSDAFCAIGAGLHALISKGGPAHASAVDVSGRSGGGKPNAGWKNPHYSKFQTSGAKIHA